MDLYLVKCYFAQYATSAKWDLFFGVVRMFRAKHAKSAKWDLFFGVVSFFPCVPHKERQGLLA